MAPYEPATAVFVNYLAPVDLDLTDEADIRRMTRVDEIVADLQQAKTLRILVLSVWGAKLSRF
jgi:hypothetical protein